MTQLAELGTVGLDAPELILRGEISALRMPPRSVAAMQVHLLESGVDVYHPRQKRVENYANGRREWYKSLIPGCLFIGGGDEARRIVSDYADFFGWSRRFVSPHGAGQDLLRRELTSLSIQLYSDPSLSSFTGLFPGVRCKVIRGPFLGVKGYVETSEDKHLKLWARLTVLGRSTPCYVDSQDLEPDD